MAPKSKPPAGSISGIVAIAVGVLLCVLPTTASAATASAAAECPNATLAPAPGNADETSDAILCLLNRERAERGLRALRHERRLEKAAHGHSKDMVRRRYFDHTAPGEVSFIDRIRRQRYMDDARQWSAGENLAWGTGELATPSKIVDSWMKSPGHRANILSPRFREIGIGIAHGVPVAGASNGVHDGATFTTNFGAR